MNLFQAIRKNVAGTVAVVFDDGKFTYSELLDLTVNVGKAFSDLGVARGDRVALLLHDSPEFLSAFIAICSLGAIAVPINTTLTAGEQRAILNDCSAVVAVVEADLCQSLLTSAADSLHFPGKLLGVDRTRLLQAGTCGADFRVTELVRNDPPVTLYDFRDTLLEARSLPDPKFDQDATEPAFILYTSGSTGDPKGAVHRQSDIFVTNETFSREVLELKPADRLFSSSRLPFAYGLGNSFTFPLLNGATSILCRTKPTSQVISKVFRKYRPTIFFGVPVVYNLLLEHHRVEPVDSSSLRLCVSAGEALPAQLGKDWQRTFGVPILDGIGSTEMLHMFMSNHLTEVRYGTSGKVLNGYEAKLLGENGKPTPPDAEGNLWVKGESAALGYWQRPVETARTFVNGWVRTGDLYRCDSNGYWSHMGRSDDCFKSSGRWVSPIEVEGVLVRHGRVSRTAVVEDFDENGLPCASAFVVVQNVESEFAELESELRALASESLPRFKRPRRYVFVDELPYTATGKVQRFKLRAQLRQQHSSASAKSCVNEQTGSVQSLWKQPVVENLKSKMSTMNPNSKSLQETYAPGNECFGCGPANSKGLHIRSFKSGDEFLAEWMPSKEYEAFTGMLNGGIIGTLLDCHCNWAATIHLMEVSGDDHPPCTVTADYAIKLLRPTPTDTPIKLVARVVETAADRAVVEGELIAHDKVCATCRGTFVAVKPGHPAYHRW